MRKRFPGAGIVNALVDLPLALSPVVVGLMLFLLYGRTGWFGSWLTDQNVQVLFATPSLVIATIFVSLPFVAREVVPTLRELGDDQEQAAHTLGASNWQTFWRVTLPSIRWAVIYGVVLTTARCLGEYGAVAVVSGNLQDQTQTLTLFVQDRFQNFDQQAAYAAAFALAVVLVVLTGPPAADGSPVSTIVPAIKVTKVGTVHVRDLPQVHATGNQVALPALTFNPAAYAMWEPEIRNFGGTWGSNSGFDASQFPNENEGIGHRHKKGAVIAGFSGQVHFIKFEDFVREQKYNKPGLLWCVPNSKTGE